MNLVDLPTLARSLHSHASYNSFTLSSVSFWYSTLRMVAHSLVIRCSWFSISLALLSFGSVGDDQIVTQSLGDDPVVKQQVADVPVATQDVVDDPVATQA
eukprot:6236718-Pyramimonas_sp.AAC.1